MINLRVPISECDACGARNDGASCVSGGDNRPLEGDVSVCIYCGHISVYGEDLRLRAPSVAQLEKIRHDARVMATIRICREALGDSGYRPPDTPKR